MQRIGWRQRERTVKVLAGVSSAGFLVAFCLIFLLGRVCDEQLTNQGSKVSVCRHRQVSDPPLAILGILLVGLLMVAFPIAEISVFGFFLKQRVENAQAAAEQAELAAQSATEAAEQAEHTARLADGASKAADETAANARAAARSANDGFEVLQEMLRTRRRDDRGHQKPITDVLAPLIHDYDQIRLQDPRSSHARTARLTAVIGRMIAALDGKGTDAIDVAAALTSDDLGTRVAAYAYFYATPDKAKMSLLVDAVVHEPPVTGSVSTGG